ncbi:unnamed protein product [Pleuronectes platessa]|uniref:Uncharacterized protein n=1 Tax=Pleuronectes platessa TaxID=8262 RepID=A0A9N7U1R6_PLEPL|nr:unnamed protein product [Pleuronectes platessa]
MVRSRMKDMVTVLGQPQDHLLRAGRYSEQFFIEKETAEEFTAVNNVETEEEESFIEQPNSLNGLIHIHPKLGAAEMEDRMAFVSLLEGLLHLYGDERVLSSSSSGAALHLYEPPETDHLRRSNEVLPH